MTERTRTVELDSIQHYLIVLDRDLDCSFIFDFGEDSEEAHIQYAHHEFLRHECCLFGADSPETLRKTHGNWFLGEARLVNWKAVQGSDSETWRWEPR